MPGDDYFKNFRRGDPYVSITRGEMRLPGEAYERLHPGAHQHTSPLNRALSRLGLASTKETYDNITRLEILADTSPWSPEYKSQFAITRAEPPDADVQERINAATHRAAAVKKTISIHDHHFDAKVTTREFTLQRVLDPNTFQVDEDFHARNSAKAQHQRWAGRGANHRALPGLGADPGATVKAIYGAHDDTERDQLRTRKATLYVNGVNIKLM